jgi:hypothetical protein
LAGSVQPLILSKPLCSAHQAAAASSASARVGAVNSRQYFAFFNTSDGNLSPSHLRESVLRRHLQSLIYPHQQLGVIGFNNSLRAEGAEGSARRCGIDPGFGKEGGLAPSIHLAAGQFAT